MPLSPAERQAGRQYRGARQAALDALNEQDPPGMLALPFWRVVRHECRAAGGASVGISLREVYEPSPEVRVEPASGGKFVSPAGQFAWIWKKGVCSGCGLVVRTARGRCVVATDRGPDHGRVHGGQAGAHAGDTRQPRA
jgi:hypothetical protein